MQSEFLTITGKKLHTSDIIFPSMLLACDTWQEQNLFETAIIIFHILNTML